MMNVQYVVRGDSVMVIECNPRASRTVPFISKATGVPLAKVATRVLVGEKLRDMRLGPSVSGHFSVKAPVFPFDRFADADPLLGPEMRSTGEAMGIDRTFGGAFRQSAHRRRPDFAGLGEGVHLGRQPGQTLGRPDSAGVRGPRFRGRGERGDGRGPEEQRVCRLRWCPRSGSAGTTCSPS